MSDKLPLPEPTGYRYQSHGHRARWVYTARQNVPLAEPLFTADQMHAYAAAARAQALEEAAKLCERHLGTVNRLASCRDARDQAARACAAAIRALAQEGQG